MSNQSDIQALIRAATGTSLTYEGDWHALFDLNGITTGPFDGRMVAYINNKLSTSYTNTQEAMNALAVSEGFYNWSSMNVITFSGATYTPKLDFSDARNSQYAALV